MNGSIAQEAVSPRSGSSLPLPLLVPPALSQAPGPYRMTGEAADGAVLFDLGCDMTTVAHGDGRSGFTFALPLQPGWPESLAWITLSGPGGIFTLDGDGIRPVTALRDGPTGQVTGIVRELAAAAALRGATESGPYRRRIPELNVRAGQRVTGNRTTPSDPVHSRCLAGLPPNTPVCGLDITRVTAGSIRGQFIG